MVVILFIFIGDILRIVGEATGVSRASVSRIVVEGRASTSFTSTKPGTYAKTMYEIYS